VYIRIVLRCIERGRRRKREKRIIKEVSREKELAILFIIIK
jgi:hypothetical protein